MANLLQRTFQLYKDAFSGHPKKIWILAFLTTVNRMGTLVIPFLSVYLTSQLGFSLKEAGFLALGFGFGSFTGSWLGGKLSSKLGANTVIILSLLSSGLLFISLQFVSSFWGFFALIYFTASCGEAYRPALTVKMSELVPQAQMGRTTSLIRIAINLGMAAGPAIGGFIAATISYSWLFWIDGTTCILAGLFFLIISWNWKKSQDLAPGKQEESAKKEEKEALPPYRNGKYLIFLLSTFLLGFVFVQWIFTFPVFLKEDWGFDERYIGIVMGLSCLIVVIFEMPIVHLLEASNKIKKSMLIGILLIGGSYLFYLLPAHLAFCFIGTTIWTFGEIINLPFNNSVALNMSPNSKKGDYMSWYWMTWSLTNITAPFIGLTVAEEFGFPVLWIGLSVVAIISFLILWQIKGKGMDSPSN